MANYTTLNNWPYKYIIIPLIAMAHLGAYFKLFTHLGQPDNTTRPDGIVVVAMKDRKVLTLAELKKDPHHYLSYKQVRDRITKLPPYALHALYGVTVHVGPNMTDTFLNRKEEIAAIKHLNAGGQLL